MLTSRRVVGAGFAVACAMATAELEETPQSSEPTAVEEVVTVGTRGKPRAAVDTAVPVDVFTTSRSVHRDSHPSRR